MTRFILIFLSMLVFAASRAFAADPFTVSGVSVDATARTAIEAQTLAIQDGQLRAAQNLLIRLTLESERMAKPLPELTPENVGKMIRAMEVNNEKRSANRYLGDIAVAFNPREVQSFLRANELTLVNSQSRERLVLVIGEPGGLRGSLGGLERGSLGAALASPRFTHALTPLKSAEAADAMAIENNRSEDALKMLGQDYGVDQILLVEAQGSSGAQVTDIALDSGLRSEFYVASNGSQNALAAKIVERLENDWKAASAVVASEVVTTTISVLFDSQSEWQRLQQAINTSAQIQDARLDALSKDGALMSVTYGGDMNRLRNELAFKGVDVRNDPELGLVFARTGRF